MKKIGVDRLKSIVYESVAARSPFPNGEGKEEGASPPKKEANPVSLCSAAPSKGRGSRGHSLLPMEGGAPKGRRLDGESGMKKSGGDRLKQAIYESTRAPLARSPFPSRGRCPVGADRAQTAGKTDEESGTYGESVNPLAKISHFARNDDTGI